MKKVPSDFTIRYKPPGEDYKKLDVVLDSLHERLNTIEDGLD